jgi:hypothetical protein
MVEKQFPATVHVFFDNVNSESYQTFLAYCDRLEYKYDVEMGKRWSRKFGQRDKWSYCLMAGTLCPLDQERP